MRVPLGDGGGRLWCRLVLPQQASPADVPVKICVVMCDDSATAGLPPTTDGVARLQVAVGREEAEDVLQDLVGKVGDAGHILGRRGTKNVHW